MTVEFHVFAAIIATQCPNERDKEQNKHFQNASLLMKYYSCEIGQLSILKNQTKRQAILLLLKVQISSDRPSSNTN